MKTGRFFVTYFMILGLLALVAVNAAGIFQSLLEDRQVNPTTLAVQGNEKIQQLLGIQRELQATYGLSIGDSVQPFSWKTLSLTQRRDVQGKLALYLSLVNQVLAIDAQKNITIDNRSQLFSARDTAEAYQKAVESFERVYGENYRPKNRLI